MQVTVSALRRRKDREGYWLRVYDRRTRRRTWVKAGDSYQESHRGRARVLREALDGDLSRESALVEVAVARFARQYDGRLCERARAIYATHFENWVTRWRGRRVDALAVRDVEDHFRALEKRWKGSSLNRERSVLRGFFRYCRDNGWTRDGADPTRTIRRYRDAVARATTILEPSQITALLDACRRPYSVRAVGRRNTGGRAGGAATADARAWEQPKVPPAWLFVAVRLGLETIARLGTILRLRWENVDDAAGVLRVPAAEVKNATELEVPLSAGLRALLGERGEPAARVLADAPDGRAVARAFSAAVKRAGIARCSFHDLRKTGAMSLLRRGVALPIVQALGGWRNPSVLLKHYTAASMADKRGAVEVLASLTSGA